MNKHILYVALALLAAMPATGQISPYRKLYADPKRPGILMDSAQIKIAIAREAFLQSQIAQGVRLKAQGQNRLSNVVDRVSINDKRSTINDTRPAINDQRSSPLGTCTVKAS